MAGTPGCYRPTASQSSSEGAPAPSGNVSPLQETPVTFQLLWRALSVLLWGQLWVQPLGQAPAALGCCDSAAYTTTQKRQPRRNGRRGGVFISHEVLAVQGLKGRSVPLPVPRQEPLVPSTFPGTATPGCVCVLCSIFSDLLPFFFFLQRLGRGFSFFFSFCAPAQ